MKKGAIEFSFTWIFAILAGIFILGLAIYFSVKIISIGNTNIDARVGKEIGFLLNPLETGFESLKASSFTMPVETRIYNKCNTDGNFGKQLIHISQKSFNKWTDTNLDAGFSNKFIFSKNYSQGKKFYVFSKPFEFPFKVADLIYLTSTQEKYCFINAPKKIKEELENLNQENILIENCSAGSVQVCFSGSCDIEVNYDEKYLEKNSKKIYFETDALMYAGIFSEKEVYECQVKRLMQRISELAKIYQEKSTLTSRVGCNSNINGDLMVLMATAENFAKTGTSAQLNSITEIIQQINTNNHATSCRMW